MSDAPHAEHTIGIRHCARCNGDHPRITFHPFKQSITDKAATEWTHWASCPETGEPILMRFVTLQSSRLHTPPE